MVDLTPEQVQTILRGLGLEATADDLPEVTHRFNAAQQVLVQLDHPDLDLVEPISVFWLDEESIGD
jgi:hypothetical protein